MSHTQAACEEMQLLIQADLDGELDAAATAVLSAHVRDCPGCAALQADLVALSAQLRGAVVHEPAPARLRQALEAILEEPKVVPFRRRRFVPFATFGAGAAIAAALMLTVVGPGVDPSAELVAGHVRALQPGHLIDVASSDQHTVKPWFDGRIDYAPPVNDFKQQGFPLEGGRLDYVGGRAVAALVYRRNKHPIDLYVWPGAGESAPAVSVRDGYTVVGWSRGGMVFRAVSDLNAAELSEFAELWRGER